VAARSLRGSDKALNHEAKARRSGLPNNEDLKLRREVKRRGHRSYIYQAQYCPVLIAFLS
jgi:hypothetical protein